MSETLKAPDASCFRMVVCVKQVPSGTQAKLDPVTKTLVRNRGESILNPYDSFAVEAALQIRDMLRKGKKQAGTRKNVRETPAYVTAVTMGVPSAEAMMKDLISRGVDEGVLMTDRVFAGADTLATSRTLALGIRNIGKMGMPSLIVCGHMAVDGDTAQIGPELAQALDIPHVSNVLRILEVKPEEGYITAECIRTEGKQTLKVMLPALITVSRDINVLRLPSIAGIRKAEQTAVRVMSASDLGADPEILGKKGSATQVVRTFTPDFSVRAERITGTPKEIAVKVRELIGRAV